MSGIGESRGIVSGVNPNSREWLFTKAKGVSAERQAMVESLPVALTPNTLLKAIPKLRPSLGTSEGMLAEQCEEKGPRGMAEVTTWPVTCH